MLQAVSLPLEDVADPKRRGRGLQHVISCNDEAVHSHAAAGPESAMPAPSGEHAHRITVRAVLPWAIVVMDTARYVSARRSRQLCNARTAAIDLLHVGMGLLCEPFAIGSGAL